MNNELRCGRKRSWPALRYYTCSHLEVPEKTSKTVVRVICLGPMPEPGKCNQLATSSGFNCVCNLQFFRRSLHDFTE
jgi:hypothetical protein